MAKNTATKEKATTNDVLNNLSKKFKLDNLPSYKLFNLFLTFLGVILIIFLNVQPVFVLVNEIIITIGNIIITIVDSNAELLKSNATRDSISFYISIGFLLFETIVCLIYCYFAKKKENANSNLQG